MPPQFWFPCFDCGGQVGPLIRGSCRFCEPELHAAHTAMLDEIGRAMDAYQQATGKEALEDFDAFEEWVVRSAP